MEIEPIPIIQLPLFSYGESISNIVELFPAVWKVTESLSSPDPFVRKRSLDMLFEIGAQRVSPLVAYMVATRLGDPDLPTRVKVVHVLGDILVRNPTLGQPPDEVREVVSHFLHNLNETLALGLLEVSIADPGTDEAIYHLFNACPYAGRLLGEILMQWKNPLGIRQKAAYFIGQVGYVEALPIIERLLTRLEARQNGQYLMDFAPPSPKLDDDLLPYLRIANNQLKAH